jgi:hypothetical protein
MAEKLWLLIDNEMREVTVANRNILSLNPITGAKEPMALTRVGPAPTSVDVVASKMFKQCGFRRSDRHPHGKVLTPRRVVKFLVAHISHVAFRERLWLRLFGKNIPATCKTNGTWLDISSQQGAIFFDPAFWTRLFQDVDCRVSHEIIASSTALNTYSVMASQCGIDYTQRILPFMFVEALLGKNYMELIRYDGFMQYMYQGVLPSEAQRTALCNTYSKMAVMKSNIPESVENAYVILFCSSYFRGFPVSRPCIRTKTIPMLDVVPTKAELDAWAAEEEAKARETKLLEMRKRDEEMAAAAEAARQQTSPTETLSMIATPKAQIPMPAEVPPYVPYPSSRSDDWKKMVEVMGQIACKTGPVGNQVRFLKWLADGGTFGTEEERVAVAKTFLEYGKHVGYSMLVDRWVVLQSAMVCLLGGNDWIDVYAALFAGMPKSSNPTNARNALRLLGDAGMAALLRAIDVSGITSVPMSVMRVAQDFLAVVGGHLKAEDKTAFDAKFPAMMMVIYNQASEDPLAWVDVWRSFGWSHTIGVTNAVTEWKRKYPTLPIEVRAEILSTFILPHSNI